MPRVSDLHAMAARIAAARACGVPARRRRL